MRREHHDSPDAPHISTGKHPYPVGEEHAPQWGEWFPDGPVLMRYCQYPSCDLEDFQ